MSNTLDYFKQLTQIPHCSHQAQAMYHFLISFGHDRGYKVITDEADNILISKGTPTLCLQAHYDMVCMGKAPEIKTYEEDGWLRAKGSSLGADNGIAIAMMMVLMDEGRELEFLLTADEEVGLIGAKALMFDLQSSAMLNLDSEEEAEVCIGCAGGADIKAQHRYELERAEGQCYRLTVSDLPGGHSGVDIDKDIPNAIKELARYLSGKHVGLVSFRGGERINSIPTHAEAVVYSMNTLTDFDHVAAETASHEKQVIVKSKELIALLDSFDSGVRSHNEKLQIPDTSINLALIQTGAYGEVTVEVSPRAMSADGLKSLTDETATLFEASGFSVRVKDKYPAWKPEKNSLTALASECMIEVFGKSRMMAIHAGLECGVLSEKYPHMHFASIGPTIRYPHSTREAVNIESVSRTFEVVQKIVARIETHLDSYGVTN